MASKSRSKPVDVGGTTIVTAKQDFGWLRSACWPSGRLYGKIRPVAGKDNESVYPPKEKGGWLIVKGEKPVGS